MKKKNIIDHISTITNFCVADGNTYLYAKCVSTVLEDNKKLPIGGGNFTVLLATLATLEFLGTINAITKGSSGEFWNIEEIGVLESTKEELNNKYKDKSWLKDFVLRPFNQLPEVGSLKKSGIGCLIDFLKETKALTGLNDGQISEIRTIRNKLAHEFTPKTKAALGIDFVPGSDFLALALIHEQKDVYCLSTDNQIGINSNSLNRKLVKLLKYVIEKLTPISEESTAMQKISLYLEKT